MNLTGQTVFQKGQQRRRKRSHEEIEDAKFRAWLRTLPSAYSGEAPCQACHYRTAANSGTGIKPLFSAIPLTAAEHRKQHAIGQYAFADRGWWEQKVQHYLRMWRVAKGEA